MSGLHQHSDSTQIYVSRGTGYWGPPMRLGAPAEITLVEVSRGEPRIVPVSRLADAPRAADAM
jgi:hypothetical protein